MHGAPALTIVQATVLKRKRDERGGREEEVKCLPQRQVAGVGKILGKNWGQRH